MSNERDRCVTLIIANKDYSKLKRLVESTLSKIASLDLPIAPDIENSFWIAKKMGCRSHDIFKCFDASAAEIMETLI